MFVLLTSAQSQEADCPQSAPAGASDDVSLFANDGRPHELSGKGLWIGGVPFTSGDIASAKPTPSRLGPGEWIVALTFTEAGNAKFMATQHCRIDHQLEISFDGRVIAEPFLNTYITDGTAEIYSAKSTHADAAAIAAKILRVRAGLK
jgi:preprotein translocase subunit SecD